jgi:hypothetical protein
MVPKLHAASRMQQAPHDLSHPDLDMCICALTRGHGCITVSYMYYESHARGSCRTISVSSHNSPAYPTKQLPPKAVPHPALYCMYSLLLVIETLYHFPLTCAVDRHGNLPVWRVFDAAFMQNSIHLSYVRNKSIRVS